MVSGPDRGALRAPLGRREGAAPERGSGRLHHEAVQHGGVRGACRPARARRDRAGRGLSRRAAGIGAVALSRARAWLLWVGVFVFATAALRAYRGGTDVVYAVLTYLLVVLGGSVSGSRPLG